MKQRKMRISKVLAASMVFLALLFTTSTLTYASEVTGTLSSGGVQQHSNSSQTGGTLSGGSTSNNSGGGGGGGSNSLSGTVVGGSTSGGSASSGGGGGGGGGNGPVVSQSSGSSGGGTSGTTSGNSNQNFGFGPTNGSSLSAGTSGSGSDSVTAGPASDVQGVSSGDLAALGNPGTSINPNSQLAVAGASGIPLAPLLWIVPALLALSLGAYGYSAYMKKRKGKL